jgi:hypothetical protein
MLYLRYLDSKLLKDRYIDSKGVSRINILMFIIKMIIYIFLFVLLVWPNIITNENMRKKGDIQGIHRFAIRLAQKFYNVPTTLIELHMKVLKLLMNLKN